MRAVTASTILVAVSAMSGVAPAQTGTAPFCLQGPAETRCVFGTMGECERARGDAPASQCITRADAQGTTGLGEPPTQAPSRPFGRPPPAERATPGR